jgi:hypothetical protein
MPSVTLGSLGEVGAIDKNNIFYTKSEDQVF